MEHAQDQVVAAIDDRLNAYRKALDDVLAFWMEKKTPYSDARFSSQSNNIFIANEVIRQAKYIIQNATTWLSEDGNKVPIDQYHVLSKLNIPNEELTHISREHAHLVNLTIFKLWTWLKDHYGGDRGQQIAYASAARTLCRLRFKYAKALSNGDIKIELPIASEPKPVYVRQPGMYQLKYREMDHFIGVLSAFSTFLSWEAKDATIRYQFDECVKAVASEFNQSENTYDLRDVHLLTPFKITLMRTAFVFHIPSTFVPKINAFITLHAPNELRRVI